MAFAAGFATALVAVAYLIWKMLPRVPMAAFARRQRDIHNDMLKSAATGEPAGYRELKGGEFFENCEIGLAASYSGWLTVTSEFYRFPQLASLDSLPKPDNDDTTISGVTAMFKGRKGKAREEEEDPSMKTSNQLNRIRRKHRFYAVLKHGNLFLYADETKTNTKAVIVLSRFLVTMWPRDLKESQLFTKRSAVCLINKDSLTPLDMESLLANSDEFTTVPKGSHFLYSDTHNEKEDLYLVLLKALKRQDAIPAGTMDDLFDPSLFAKTLHFFTSDMNDLQQRLNSTENQLTTKWFNALLGRVFLAIYHTPEFEASCIDFVATRLKKIKIPGFLDDLQIRRIEVGHSAPFLTNPRLERFSPEGDLDVIFNFSYQGGCVIEIATKLFLNITGFKQREFDVILKIKVKKINGDILVHMKKQPSNRFWYGFTKSPEMELDIEPVFSSRALTYSIVTNIIQAKFREALNQSLVLPFMDNIAFYNTSEELYRAGIWNKQFRSKLGNMEEFQSTAEPLSSPPSLPARETVSSAVASATPQDQGEDVEVETAGVTSGVSIKSSGSKRRTALKASEADNGSIETPNNDNNSPLEREPTTDTMNTLNSSTSQESKIKRKVTDSYSMLRQWYNKKLPSNTTLESDRVEIQAASSETEVVYGASHSLTEDPNNVSRSRRLSHVKLSTDPKKGPNYTPPEMISNRRSKPSRGSVGSSSLGAVIDSINGDQSSTSAVSPVTLKPPASPQMFVKTEKDFIASPVRKRHPSGSYNIHTAAAENGGILELGQEPDFDSKWSDSNAPIRKSSDYLQELVATPVHEDVESSCAAVEEPAAKVDLHPELEPSVLPKRHSQLKRKPPPLPNRAPATSESDQKDNAEAVNTTVPDITIAEEHVFP